MERGCKNWQEGVKIIKQGVFWHDFSFTGDDHEEVVLTGGRLGQVLHDVPIALNQLLHLSLCVAVIFLGLVLIFTVAVLLVSFLFPVFLLFGSILKNVLCFVVLLLSLIKNYSYTKEPVWITSPYKMLEGSLPFTPPQLAGSIHIRNSQHRENEMDREWKISLEWMLWTQNMRKFVSNNLAVQLGHWDFKS